jgi:hypothetical protein
MHSVDGQRRFCLTGANDTPFGQPKLCKGGFAQPKFVSAHDARVVHHIENREDAGAGIIMGLDYDLHQSLEPF